MATLTFALPEGYPVPDNVSSGDTFEALVELKLSDWGMVEAISLDGMPLAVAEEEVVEDDAAAAEAGFLDGIEGNFA